MFVPRFSGDAAQRVGFFGPSCTLHPLAVMRMTGFHFLHSTLMAKLLPGSIAYFATSYFWIGSISRVFDEISHTTVSSEINVLNTIDHEGENFATTVAKVVDDNFSEDVNLQTNVPTAVFSGSFSYPMYHNVKGCANEEKIQEVLQSNLTGCASEEKIQEVQNKDFFVPSLPIHQGSMMRLQIKSNVERKDSLVTSTLSQKMVTLENLSMSMIIGLERLLSN
ncbi:hypothetical protein H5410_023299 [Solanum commersonii]|uniref:Uncharacterized protein n=1 Tax=Solanum commersonii TaxID=4109 RepID=A0A9J5ZH62_SOLCO|nr:hypothetical protein H5410_023299 [Solanum commersonii]